MNNGTMMYPEDSIFYVEDKKGGLQREKKSRSNISISTIRPDGLPSSN